MSQVYLLHFDQPYKHARHYIGWTNDLAARVELHANGGGARLMAVVSEANITFQEAGVADMAEVMLPYLHVAPGGVTLYQAYLENEQLAITAGDSA